MARLVLALIVASAVLVGCSSSNESDPALNVKRPEGAQKPGAPGVGGQADSAKLDD